MEQEKRKRKKSVKKRTGSLSSRQGGKLEAKETQTHKFKARWTRLSLFPSTNTTTLPLAYVQAPRTLTVRVYLALEDWYPWGFIRYLSLLCLCGAPEELCAQGEAGAHAFTETPRARTVSNTLATCRRGTDTSSSLRTTGLRCTTVVDPSTSSSSSRFSTAVVDLLG